MTENFGIINAENLKRAHAALPRDGLVCAVAKLYRGRILMSTLQTERTRRIRDFILLIRCSAGGNDRFGWTANTAESFKLLDALMEAGLNAIDTADAYSRWVPGHQGGESEAIMGVWMKERGNRDKVIVATKVGMDLAPGKSGLSKARIKYAVENLADPVANRLYRSLPGA